MVGRTLGHFQIIDKLGAGGMGEVYSARDLQLNRLVAIKVLPPATTDDPVRRLRFIQEARAASALNHPNIVTIHEISRSEGLDFIAMEIVPGRTLARILRDGPPSMRDVAAYASKVAGALHAAHVAHIVHRDLKPGNVMVTPDGLVKVLDFGLAKLTAFEPVSAGADTETMGPLTGAGIAVGTPAYMSPEQSEGKPVDARSDIFSFGAVLYEMVTGRPAFQGSSNVATLAEL